MYKDEMNVSGADLYSGLQKIFPDEKNLTLTERLDAARGPLLSWYRENRRDLPWRENRDAYRIWISEIMLQQTRVEAVKPYFTRFMEHFPTVQALADCDGIVFLVADQPLLSASAVRAVVRQWREHPSCIVGAACGTRRGNPNVFPREFFPALCALEGDRGGSAVIRQYPERYLAVDVPPEALADVDTPEALRAIRDHL